MNDLTNENRELRRAITETFFSLFGPGMSYSDEAYNLLAPHVDQEQLKQLFIGHEQDYADLQDYGWEVDLN